MGQQIRHRLGLILMAVSLLGFVVALLGCPPGEEPPAPEDNLSCRLSGFDETSIRGSIRTSFDYEGGDCRCMCTGVPYDLICTVEAP